MVSEPNFDEERKSEYPDSTQESNQDTALERRIEDTLHKDNDSDASIQKPGYDAVPLSLKDKEEKYFREFRSTFSGPLPPPAILDAYNRSQPDAADRILRMAEAQMQHRHRIESRYVSCEVEDVKDERKEKARGQAYGFSIGIIGIIAGAIVSIYGNPIAGGAIGTGPFHSQGRLKMLEFQADSPFL